MVLGVSDLYIYTWLLAIILRLPVHINSVQSLSNVQLFLIPWTGAHHASLSITNSQSLLELMSIKQVMPSNHLILCHPLLLLPSIFPSIKVFSNDQFFTSTEQSIGASASVLPNNIQDWFPLGLTALIFWQSKGLSRVFSNNKAQKHQFFSVQHYLWSNSHIHIWPLEKP